MAFDPNSPAQTHNAFSDLDAIRENFAQLRKFESGAAAPSNLVAGMFWLDTSSSPYILKQRNAANTGWMILWTFDNLPIKHPSGGEQGDILYHNGSSYERLPHGNSGEILKTQGHGANPVWGTVSAASFPAATVGDYMEGSHAGGGGGYDSYTKVGEVYIARSGSYRIRFSLVSENMYGRIYKNGVAFGTEKGSSSGNYYDDLSFSSGDLCQLYIRNRYGGGTEVSGTGPRVCSGNPINPSPLCVA